MSASDTEIFFDNALQIRPITQQPQQVLKKIKNKKKKNNASNMAGDVVSGGGNKQAKTPSKKSKKTKKNKKNHQNLNDSGTVVNEEISYLAEKQLNIEEHNDTIRWTNKRESEEDEENRLKIYKINRRKRYIEQRNKVLGNITGSMSSSMNVNNSSNSGNGINAAATATINPSTTATNRSNTDSAISSLSSNSK